jgi:hypothetical protein
LENELFPKFSLIVSPETINKLDNSFVDKEPFITLIKKGIENIRFNQDDIKFINEFNNNHVDNLLKLLSNKKYKETNLRYNINYIFQNSININYFSNKQLIIYITYNGIDMEEEMDDYDDIYLILILQKLFSIENLTILYFHLKGKYFN